MKAQIVSFHCVFKDRLGQVLSSSFNQDVINQVEESASGDEGGARLRGLVAGIQDVRPGEKRSFKVPADEAYGPYDPKLVLNVARSELSKGSNLEIGSEVCGQSGPSGPKQVYRVIEQMGDIVVLDGNHPLAGQDLMIDVEIVSARDACHSDYEDDPVVTAIPSAYLH